MTDQKALRYEAAGSDGVGVVWFDVPGQKVNTLQIKLLAQFETVFDQARHDGKVRAIVLASGKKSGFIAGADIGDLNGVQSAADGARLSRNGQAAMDQIASLPVPVVAAIQGTALAVALNLRWRVTGASLRRPRRPNSRFLR